MLWDKETYKIDVNNGCGSVETKPVSGLLSHLVIEPIFDDTRWNLKILDSDKDVIYSKDCIGRLDDKEGLPVGRAALESLKLCIVGAYRRKFFIKKPINNEQFHVIIKVREIR